MNWSYLVLRKLKGDCAAGECTWSIVGTFNAQLPSEAIETAARQEYQRRDFDMGETQEYVAFKWVPTTTIRVEPRFLFVDNVSDSPEEVTEPSRDV